MSSTTCCSDFPVLERRLAGVFAGVHCCQPQQAALPEAEFNDLALALFRRQFMHNAPYRRLCQARGARPEKTRDWRQIPYVPTTAFKELAVSCLEPGQRTAVFCSSGTTGQEPSRHYHSPRSLAIYQAALTPWFEANVLGGPAPAGGWQWAILAPPRGQAPHSSLVHMFDALRLRAGMPEGAFLGGTNKHGAWTLDLDGAVAVLHHSAQTGTPLLLLGTAFMFAHLLDHLARQRLKFALPWRSRAMETGGYKGRARALPAGRLHALITRRLGIPSSAIIREYGMTELSSQAYDRPLQGRPRLFRFPCWARAQIISPETGREAPPGAMGLIRVLDLANIYSVLALQTEDLGVRRDGGFELLGRAGLAEPRGCSLMAAVA